MTKLDENALRVMICAEEDERLEFKRALLSTKDITEYAVALANEGGGWLIMGVTNAKPRKIVGVSEQTHEDLQKIQSATLDSAGMKIRLHQVSTSDGWVLAVEIPSRLPGKVFHTKMGKYLMRAGESLRGMPNEEIAAIFDEVAPRSGAVRPRLGLVNELRQLAADRTIVRIQPIVPRNREADGFQVDAATDKTLSLRKLSSGHYIELPISRVNEVLALGGSVPPTIVLNGRLQWIGVDASWHFFSDAPSTEREKNLGFEKMSSLGDPRVRALQRQLEPNGIRFHFSHERDVPAREGTGWEVLFDADGRFFRIVNGSESLILMILRSVA
jgi:schlafen family protein